MDAVAWIFLILIYLMIGQFVANRFYFPRRHGVRGRLGRGWRASTDSGWIGAMCVSFIWPVAFFLPSVRNPQLCTHPHHVHARQQQRREAESYREALRQEREGT